MIWLFLFYGAGSLALFLYVSKKIGSILNIVTIPFGLKFAVEFVLEPIVYFLGLANYDYDAMTVVYTLSFLGFSAFSLGIVFAKPEVRTIREVRLPNNLIIAWIFLLMAFALYAPVIIEFSQYITEPRRIYELTRTGYGLNTYGSSLMAFLAYIVFLTSTKRWGVAFYSVLVILLILKGSKGSFLVMFSIFVIFKVHAEGRLFSLSRSVVYAIIGVIAFGYLFAFNYRGETANLLVTVAEYSDYNRNGSLVVQDGTMGQYGGQLIFESTWISKVPRAVWPEKPKVFGEFRLALQYYPEWFMLDQGSPAFGLGVVLADFGWWAFLYYPATQLISGLLLGYCLSSLRSRFSILPVVMALYLAGNNLLSSGSGNYILEHLIIASILGAILRVIAALGSHDLGAKDDWASARGRTEPSSPRRLVERQT